MSDVKKRWVPIFFPMGEFKGSVNLSIKGESVVSAETAKQMIDIIEAQENANTPTSNSDKPGDLQQ